MLGARALLLLSICAQMHEWAYIKSGVGVVVNVLTKPMEDTPSPPTRHSQGHQLSMHWLWGNVSLQVMAAEDRGE